MVCKLFFDRIIQNNPAIISLPDAIFKIADTKLYVPAVTLSTEDDNKLLEEL